MLKNIQKHLRYLNYVVRHKYYVARECFKHGLIWRGLIHDWTKFLPCEWFPYVESFYGGYTKDTYPKCIIDAFNDAWKHHYRCNDHHWEHWSLFNNKVALRMSYDAVVEMLCDWKGASAAKNKGNTWQDVNDWYYGNGDNMYLHEDTRTLVTMLLRLFTME